MTRAFFNKLLFVWVLLLQIFANAQYSRNNPETFDINILKDQKNNGLNWLSKEADNPAFALPNFDDKDWKKFELGISENNKEEIRSLIYRYMYLYDRLSNDCMEMFNIMKRELKVELD